MAFVQEGISNCETRRRIGRSEAAIVRVERAALVLGTSVTPKKKKDSGLKRKTVQEW